MAKSGDGVAVITGAGSGMGRCLAQKLAARGYALALADVSAEGIETTVASLCQTDAKVTQHRVNVAEEAEVMRLAEEVEQMHGGATHVFNNAGVALLGTFEEVSLTDFRWLMDINFWGVVYGSHYFLPQMKRQKRAHLVNTSSLLGFFGAIGQGAYCASKFAVRGFTESLRHELAATSVCVTCVHPGFVRTSIAESARKGAKAGTRLREESLARFQQVARTAPEAAAEKILRGVERGKARILIGADAYFVDFWQRLKPESYWNLLAKQFKDPTASR